MQIAHMHSNANPDSALSLNVWLIAQLFLPPTVTTMSSAPVATVSDFGAPGAENAITKRAASLEARIATGMMPVLLGSVMHAHGSALSI